MVLPFVNNCICFLGLDFLFAHVSESRPLGSFLYITVRSVTPLQNLYHLGGLRTFPSYMTTNQISSATSSFGLTKWNTLSHPYYFLFPMYISRIAIIPKTGTKYSCLDLPFFLHIFAMHSLHFFFHLVDSDCSLTMVFSNLLFLASSNISSSSASSLKKFLIQVTQLPGILETQILYQTIKQLAPTYKNLP